MKKEVSKRNKTLTITDEEYLYYEKNLYYPNKNSINIDDIKNKMINANFFDIIDKLPKNFVDLAIIDPPYNLTKNFHGNKFLKQSEDDYIEYTRVWLSKIIPLLKESASIYICSDWHTSTAIYMVLKDYVIIRNRITWQREKGRGAKKNYKNAMEDIWFATMSDDYYFDTDAVKMKRKVIAPYKENGKPKDWEDTDKGKFRLTYPSNFWDDISIPFWSMAENTNHPTQKPEKLIAKLILASSKDSDIILDPFLGSGTTSVVAKKLNRNYVGIEENKEYSIWALKRLELAQTNKSIQGYDGIFYERNTHL